jgi:hypothetical protein
MNYNGIFFVVFCLAFASFMNIIENDPNSDYYEKRVKALERLEKYNIEANNALENISLHYRLSKESVINIISSNNDHGDVFDYFRKELDKNKDSDYSNRKEIPAYYREN